MTAHHDDRCGNVLFLQVLQNLDPVENGHLDVEEDGVVRSLDGLVNSILAAPGLIDAISLIFEGHPDCFTYGGLVVDHQDSIGHSSLPRLHELGQLYGLRVLGL